MINNDGLKYKTTGHIEYTDGRNELTINELPIDKWTND